MQKNKVIGIGSLSIHLVYQFVVPFLRQMRSLTLTQLNIVDQRKAHPFITTFIMFLSLMLAGCLNFISLFLTKTTLKKKSNSKLIIHSRILKKFKKGSKKRKSRLSILLILLVASLDCVSTTGLSIATQSIGDNLDLRFQLKAVQIAFVAVLCYYILSYKVFRHHYLSILLIFIGVFPITYKSFPSMDFLVLIIIILSFAFLGAQQTIEKYIMHYEYFSPFRILFFEGVFGMLITAALILIVSFVPCPSNWFCEGRNLEDPVKFYREMTLNGAIFLFLIHVISLMGINICNFLINKHYSPAHVVVSDVIVSIVDWIVGLIQKSTSSGTEVIVPLIGYILISFGCLVYNEIIIIYLCGLGEYTKTEITKRSALDFVNYIDLALFDDKKDSFLNK